MYIISKNLGDHPNTKLDVMKNNDPILRFVYSTQGVCPPEIHFKINKDIVEEVRFVGGGCPGNAQLVARLLKGRPIKEVLNHLDGINCRNQTSCPDQLARAIISAANGDLKPAASFRTHQDMGHYTKVGLIGELTEAQDVGKITGTNKSDGRGDRLLPWQFDRSVCEKR